MIEIQKRETAHCVPTAHPWKEWIYGFLQRCRKTGSQKKRDIQKLREQLAAAEETMDSLRQEIAARETEKQNLIWRQELQLRNMEISILEKVKTALSEAGKLDFDAMGEEARIEACCFPVTEDPESGRWRVSMNICSLGGCEYNDYEFNTEREACLFGTVLTKLGARLETKSPCPDCYAEYMQNCI